MLTVEKIGGTSMSRFDEVLKNIVLGKRDYYARILVVSAYNNVTNWLLEHKKNGTPGIYSRFEKRENYMAALDELLFKLLAINAELAPIGLDLKLADDFITERICQAKNYLNSLG